MRNTGDKRESIIRGRPIASKVSMSFVDLVLMLLEALLMGRSRGNLSTSRMSKKNRGLWKYRKKTLGQTMYQPEIGAKSGK